MADKKCWVVLRDVLAHRPNNPNLCITNAGSWELYSFMHDYLVRGHTCEVLAVYWSVEPPDEELMRKMYTDPDRGDTW